MPKYNICLVPKGQSSCDEMLPSSGFLGRGYSTAEDKAQVMSNYQKLVNKGKIESIGPANGIVIVKHPIKNTVGNITNYQWRIFPPGTDIDKHVKSSSEEDKIVEFETKNAELATCHQNLQEKNAELQQLNTKYYTDIKNLTEQNRMQAEGITTKQNVVEILKDPEVLDVIKVRTDPSNSVQNVASEGGRRKTKKHRKKRKSSRKKYTKRRKYSRRPRTR
jgi:hypothetical protein